MHLSGKEVTSSCVCLSLLSWVHHPGRITVPYVLDVPGTFTVSVSLSSVAATGGDHCPITPGIGAPVTCPALTTSGRFGKHLCLLWHHTQRSVQSAFGMGLPGRLCTDYRDSLPELSPKTTLRLNFWGKLNSSLILIKTQESFSILFYYRLNIIFTKTVQTQNMGECNCR